MAQVRSEDCVFFLLSRAFKIANRVAKDGLGPIDLTPVQALTLGFLREGPAGGMAAGALGAAAHLDSATLTGVLDRLEATGLVRREADPQDRRALRLTLTPEGAARADAALAVIGEAHGALLARLDPAEAETLQRLLRKL